MKGREEKGREGKGRLSGVGLGGSMKVSFFLFGKRPFVLLEKESWPMYRAWKLLRILNSYQGCDFMRIDFSYLLSELVVLFRVL